MFMLGDYLTTSESVNVSTVSHHVRRVDTANARFNVVNVQNDISDDEGLIQVPIDLLHFPVKLCCIQLHFL